MTDSFKSGYASIVGRPNVGKSTLLNCLMAQKVAVTSNRPQTTRNKITGVLHLPGAQIILLDTPGIHESDRALNEMMVRASVNTFSDVDLLLVMLSADSGFCADDEFVLNSMRGIKTKKVLVINKIDLVDKSKLLSLINEMNQKSLFEEIIPISALKEDGLDELKKLILNEINAVVSTQDMGMGALEESVSRQRSTIDAEVTLFEYDVTISANENNAGGPCSVSIRGNKTV